MISHDLCQLRVRFMYHVMLALLGEEQFKDWEVPLLKGHFTLQVSPIQHLKAEASLSEKHALYNSQRPTVGKQRGDIFAAWLDILTLDSASCSISSSEPACFEHRGQKSLIFLLLAAWSDDELIAARMADSTKSVRCKPLTGRPERCHWWLRRCSLSVGWADERAWGNQAGRN